MNEILKMSREIDYKNLVYDLKGPTSPISFSKFAGPMYNYDQLKNGATKLQQVQKQQKDFKRELNEITSGDSNHKSDNQLYVIKNVKTFMTRDRKLLTYLMIMQKLDLKPFTNQNKMKLRKKDLKY